MTRTTHRVAAATVCLLLATGCSGGRNDSPRTQTLTPSPSTTTTATPDPTLTPEAQAALDAYLEFFEAANDARRAPAAFVKDEKSAEPFTSVAFDPIKTEFLAYLFGLANEQTAYRGTPSSPRVKVDSVDLKRKPYPLVVLVNCPTREQSWEKYIVKTGKSVPEANGAIPPPYKLTVSVIYHERHWGVTEVSIDKGRTCTPE